MLGRMYTIEFENITIATASGDQDLFYVAPADDKPVVIHAITLDQLSDVGDAASEMLRYRIIRGHATVGSGGTAPTPRSMRSADAAAAFTARTNDTAIASAGTPINLHSGGFNIMTGLEKWWTPECRFYCSQTDVTIVVRLMAAPVDDVIMSGTLYIEELI